jgi:hypothetical protein
MEIEPICKLKVAHRAQYPSMEKDVDGLGEGSFDVSIDTMWSASIDKLSLLLYSKNQQGC